MMRPKCVKTISVTRLVTELNLESVLGKNFNHCTNLTSNKAQFGQVTDKGHGVE